MSTREPLPEVQLDDRGLLRFLTCGSVDDGKSTLIGRLLYDSKSILADTLHAIERTSKRRGLETVDLSLLTDGLQAEREQGITIDVAYRYFSTGTRKYIIADAPGHEQYTRNMVTAASTANLAIILVDARKGVLTQTRRHSYIAHLVGIPQLVVAVNKMDLVGYSREVFEQIREAYLDFAAGLGIRDVRFIPLSALNGDMVVERGGNLAWYDGPTLMELLESAPAAHSEAKEPFRFPVQYVCRPRTGEHHDFRGYMGRVESGEIAVGNEVQVLPSGRTTHIREIRLLDQSLPQATSERSVTLLLATKTLEEGRIGRSLAHDAGELAAGHGKIILLGEHAVVYGSRAIAAPVPLAVRARVLDEDDGVWLVVPRWGVEQRLRSERLEALGALQLLQDADLEPVRLAALMDRRLDQAGRPEVGLNLDGARAAARWIDAWQPTDGGGGAP